MPPAAIAGIGAVSSIAGGLISGSAAKSAADTQAAAADRASQRALEQYQQTRADLAPYRATGQNALGVLSDILGIQGPTAAPVTSAPAAAPASAGALPPGYTLQMVGQADATESSSGSPGNYAIVDPQGNIVQNFPQGFSLELAQSLAPGILSQSGVTAGEPSARAAAIPNSGATGPNAATLARYGLSGLTFQPTQAQLEATPGYKFDLSQGLLGVANAQAAKGRGISGAALRGAAGYATGLANNTLTTQQGIFQQNLGNVINPLEWAANLGQNAAATTGQQGIAAVGNANNALIGGANAQAAGAVGAANALSSGIGGLGNAATNYLLYSQLGNNAGGGYIDNGTWG